MPDIHPTAIIEKGAQLADDVSVGAYSIISAKVKIDSNTKVGPHVVINGPTTLGKNNEIYQFASIGEAPQDKKYNGEDTELIIGDDNVIREFTTLNRGTVQGGAKTVLGNGNLIMAYVHLAHDCIIGNHNILANNVALAGHVTIYDYVILGGYSLVHQFCSIGNNAFSAMNSVVSKDIPPYLMVSGHMAKPHGLNTEGLKRHNFDSETIRLLKDAYSILYRSGLTLEQAKEKLVTLAPDNKELTLFLNFLQNHLHRGLIR
ncbi:MAG: acyl-ACP--UDP-N-acetylglucosamine O-acyltransferase [Gammaproteobacteria bacterium]|nr:acyl-ACP--UDP-N-acetylglucosamine O-acyltransferase [Gammaproteobacteria bacterium]